MDILDPTNEFQGCGTKKSPNLPKDKQGQEKSCLCITPKLLLPFDVYTVSFIHWKAVDNLLITNLVRRHFNFSYVCLSDQNHLGIQMFCMDGADKEVHSI